ncbi:MAG: DUF2309 family protein, partial [Planctomycetales bacterium]|nr:DUF2309 family protein [Planctomycetales bacterium]
MQSTTSSPGAPTTDHDDLEELKHKLEHAAHLLPSQGPITVFVHHNTLHAYESISFFEAARIGAERFQCETYFPESRYRQEMSRGRISMEDITAVLRDELGTDENTQIANLTTRQELRQTMMQYPLRVGPTAELRWVIAETDALRTFRDDVPSAVCERLVKETRRWVMRDLRGPGDSRLPARMAGDGALQEIVNHLMAQFGGAHIETWSEDTWTAFSLHLLWGICGQRVDRLNLPPEQIPLRLRPRDVLLEPSGVDADELVNEILIPFCSVFMDQGIGQWQLPNREQGFFRSFIHLYGHACEPKDEWLDGLRDSLLRLERSGATPLESIRASLQLFAIAPADEDEFIQATLLSLRGFAGMIWQLESRADRVARPISSGALVEFLAIRLILDACAARFVAKQAFGYEGALSELRSFMAAKYPPPEVRRDDQLAFLVFQLAQLMAWTPESLHRLADSDWQKLTDEIDAFSDMERRRIFQQAYERQYRMQTLDAVAVQAELAKQQRPSQIEQLTAGHRTPVFQVITCIDDREESFRRYVEETEPRAETFGAAGFFASAMYYRGNAEAHYVPLCPIIIRPNHYVQESVSFSFEDAERLRRRLRRVLGRATYRMHAGSRTVIGGFMAGIFGSLATLPLVMRILAPRITAQIRRTFGTFVRTPVITQLQIERSVDPPGPEDGHIGFSVEEMAGIVERLLRDIGLTSHLSRLVLMCGHGSSSLNNPHESAYNCGACAGARGGPNARAFAQMANDPRVRAVLAERDFVIPAETVFIGSYHNTCDDSLTYYDLDRIPVSHKPDLEHLLRVMDEVRARNAHERARRFES